MRHLLLICLLTAACVGMAWSQTPAKGQKINVYMYSEYIPKEIPEEFEKQTGIAVRIDAYENTEEMMAKMQQAGGVSQYDVLVVSDHAISVLAKLGALQPLDMAKIPNAKNQGDKFKNPPYDPGNKYSLPYQWGTIGLMYRKDKIAALDPSWAVVFDPAKQPGDFVLMDSMRDMLGGALIFQGHSVNSRNLEELRDAGNLILNAKKSKKCIGFEPGVGGKNKVAAGTVLLAICYNGDVVKAMQEDKNLGFALPKEGSIIWVDAMLIPSKAPNADGAHKFINYILDAKVGAQLSDFNCYATPNAASLALVRKEDRANPAIYPSEEQVKTLQYVEDLGKDTRMYNEVWTTVKTR
jgi:spermidine/putrescine transport system substrate-binding protein